MFPKLRKRMYMYLISIIWEKEEWGSRFSSPGEKVFLDPELKHSAAVGLHTGGGPWATAQTGQAIT